MRTLALVKRIILQMLRDKRTLALLFLAPLLILSLLYLVFDGEADAPVLGVAGVPDPVVEVLEASDLEVIPYETADGATVVEDELDGLLMGQDGSLELILLNADPAKSQRLVNGINQILALSAQDSPAPTLQSIETSYIYGDQDTDFFDVLSPVLVGFFVFFFVFLISGIGLLKERVSGTLERVMSTPIRRSEIVIAYLTGFGIFAVIQTTLVVFYAVTVLDIVLAGSIWHVLLINLMLALVALSLGIFLSTFAASEFQMVQFIPIVVVPQVFFAGIFPVDSLAEWLQALGRIMPVFYAGNALTAVMHQGDGLAEIWRDLLALSVFAAIFITLNVLSLKRYRKL